jgi:hypothetical protein
MKGRVQQLPAKKWPSAKTEPLGVLVPEPDELEKRCDLVFVTEHDDLDEVRVAVVEVKGSDREYGLLRYRGAPRRGTEVYRAVSRRDRVKDLTELIDALGLKPSEVQTLWTGKSWKDSPF